MLGLCRSASQSASTKGDGQVTVGVPKVCPRFLSGRPELHTLAEVRSRGAREVSWRGEIRVEDGGEATSRSSFRLRALASSSGAKGLASAQLGRARSILAT